MINNSQAPKRKNKPGAGRKPGTGKFGEPTTALRVPASQERVIRDFLAVYKRKQQQAGLDPFTDITLPALELSHVKRPLFLSKVPAGFPSPADDHVEKRLDPNEFLIDQADATYFVTIQGYSMVDVGLLPGDKAVVDRSKDAAIGDIVMAMVDGEFTIKTLGRDKDGSPRLMPANATGAYPVIEIREGMQFEIWGVVTGSFRRF